jgi:hypothetical protein
MSIAAAPTTKLKPGRPLVAARAVTGERLALFATAVAVAMLPLAIPQGPANMAPNDVFLALAMCTCLLWTGTAGLRLQFPYVVPVTLALIGGAAGALVGPIPLKGMFALTQDVWLIAWCWTVVNVGRTPGNLRVLLTTWAYSGIVWAMLAFVGMATGNHLLTGQVPRQGSRVQITLDDPSYAANYFLISLMIIWATQRPKPRAARWAAYALLAAAIATTGSNSGAVGLTVATIVATTLGTYRRFGIVPAVTLFSVVLLAGGVVKSTVSLQSIQSKAHDSRYAFIRDGIGRSPQSAGQRQMLLQESIHLYEQGNPLGDGPVSTKPRLQKEMVALVKEAHDDYFAALIERGPIGFIGILVLIGSLGLRGGAVATRKLSSGFADVVVRPNALAGALAGTMVAMTVYELLHVRHVWTLFAVVAALSIWGRR